MTNAVAVPSHVWELLRVKREDFRPKWWASMTPHGRTELLRVAKSQAKASYNWRAIPHEDRAVIIRLVTRAREIYRLANIETEWHRIAGGVDE